MERRSDSGGRGRVAAAAVWGRFSPYASVFLCCRVDFGCAGGGHCRGIEVLPPDTSSVSPLLHLPSELVLEVLGFRPGFVGAAMPFNLFVQIESFGGYIPVCMLINLSSSVADCTRLSSYHTIEINCKSSLDLLAFEFHSLFLVNHTPSHCLACGISLSAAPYVGLGFEISHLRRY